MKEMLTKKCFLTALALFLVTCGLIWFSHNEVKKCKKMVEEVEYYDSLNRYNKIYLQYRVRKIMRIIKIILRVQQGSTNCLGNYEAKLKIKNKQSSIVFDY